MISGMNGATYMWCFTYYITYLHKVALILAS